jgi:hypothetical protein
MQGRTTFVIAQRLSTIRRADLILVLEKGEIAARGKHEELLEESGLYAELYEMQLKLEREAAADAAAPVGAAAGQPGRAGPNGHRGRGGRGGPPFGPGASSGPGIPDPRPVRAGVDGDGFAPHAPASYSRDGSPPIESGNESGHGPSGNGHTSVGANGHAPEHDGSGSPRLPLGPEPASDRRRDA